jgi:ubiquinone/menaquinone biosynthesis C-methylase UbiE
MPWLTAAIYDRFTRPSEEACFRQWRSELLADLAGDVLEIGAGTGASLSHYPRAGTRLVLTEPDRHMRRRLRAKCDYLGMHDVEISDASASALPMASASYDGVVSLLVLCSVPDLNEALAEMFRVLRPGGCFVFLEHVAAEEKPERLKWQRRIEPVWKRLAGNCHLTRRTEQAIIDTGFEIEKIQRESIRKANPLTRPSIRGTALKPP